MSKRSKATDLCTSGLCTFTATSPPPNSALSCPLYTCPSDADATGTDDSLLKTRSIGRPKAARNQMLSKAAQCRPRNCYHKCCTLEYTMSKARFLVKAIKLILRSSCLSSAGLAICTSRKRFATHAHSTKSALCTTRLHIPWVMTLRASGVGNGGTRSCSLSISIR